MRRWIETFSILLDSLLLFCLNQRKILLELSTVYAFSSSPIQHQVRSLYPNPILGEISMVITTIKNAHPVVGVDIAVTCRAHFSSSPLAHPVS